MSLLPICWIVCKHWLFVCQAIAEYNNGCLQKKVFLMFCDHAQPVTDVHVGYFDILTMTPARTLLESRLLTNQGPDRSGSCLILIRLQPDQSGCRLILIWHVPDQSGCCLILIWHVPDRSGCRLIWSGSGLLYQASAWFKYSSSLINQAAAWSSSSASLINIKLPDFFLGAAWLIRQVPDCQLKLRSQKCIGAINSFLSTYTNEGEQVQYYILCFFHHHICHICYAWSIMHMPDQNQAAAWWIRLLPDQNQAAAWSIRHMPDQNQAAAWSKSGMPDIRQTSQPDQSCSGKSGDQANKGNSWESNHSCVPAKSPICRNPNTLSSCSISTSPPAATSSMSGRKQPGTSPGLPAAGPCPTPLTPSSCPSPWTTCPWGSPAPPVDREMSIVPFQIKFSCSCGELCWGSENPWYYGVISPLLFGTAFLYYTVTRNLLSVSSSDLAG